MSSEILKFVPLLFTICFVTFCFWAFFRLKNTFVKSARICFKKYGTFIGRASRSEYWWFYLFYIIMYIIAIAIDLSMGTPLSLVMLLFIPGIFCVSCRRMHDLDKSGWWMLISLIPFIGGLIVLFWFVSQGTEDSNYYGEVPTNTI